MLVNPRSCSVGICRLGVPSDHLKHAADFSICACTAFQTYLRLPSINQVGFTLDGYLVVNSEGLSTSSLTCSWSESSLSSSTPSNESGISVALLIVCIVLVGGHASPLAHLTIWRLRDESSSVLGLSLYGTVRTVARVDFSVIFILCPLHQIQTRLSQRRVVSPTICYYNFQLVLVTLV